MPDAAANQMQPYTLVNIFTPVPGELDALVELQLAETAKMRSQASGLGWLGNEVYRAADGSRLVIVTRFASKEAQKAWAQTDAFAAHVRRIGPLLEKVDSIPVELAAKHESVP